MKALAFAAALLLSNSAFAATQITCANAKGSVTIKVDELKSQPPQSPYVLRQGDTTLASGATVKVEEGVDPFLKTWVWGFKTEDFVGGVALTSAKLPSPGKHTGKADLFVKYQGGYWDATSADCQIEIK